MKHETVATLQTMVPNVFIEVSVSFDDGKGPGYDDGKEHKKGYILHVQPFKKDGMFREFQAYSGMKGFIEPCTRYSAKRHKELAAGSLCTDLYRRMIERVTENGGLTLLNGNANDVLGPGA